MLREVVPNVSRVAAIYNPDNPALQGAVRAIEAAAPTLGLHVTVAPVRSAAEIEGVISVFARDANGALLIVADFITLVHRELIVALVARHRLPAMYNLIAFVKSGGLMSYGIDPADLFRRAASYVDRILKGESPADLPIQQPTKFELVINLKSQGAWPRSPADATCPRRRGD
jgi:putative tryptophan/tyrosine transport system substrate-binding protein